MTDHYDAPETRKPAEREAESGNATGKISNCFRLWIAVQTFSTSEFSLTLLVRGDSHHLRLVGRRTLKTN
jgi:hypothetical protein